MNIGKLRHHGDVSSEYIRLAQEDEQAAALLTTAGKYRHAVYCVLQAMEKYIRSKVPRTEDHRDGYLADKHTSHSIQEAMKLFLKNASADPQLWRRATEELRTGLIATNKLDLLQNSLGYLFYSERTHSYWSWDVEKVDVDLLMHQLHLLKTFLQDSGLTR
jgi:HEPN domain-containing protein